MTYDELIKLVQDEIVDVDDTFFDNINLIMERAHLRIQHDLDLNATRIEEILSASTQQLTVPSELILVRGVRIANGEFLLEKDVTYLKTYWPNASLIGTPKYYAWQDDQTVLLAPTPARVDLELMYTVRIPVLSQSQQTNWLSEYTPDLLQMALLLEAAVWTKDSELVPLYSQRYATAASGVAREYNFRKRSDDYRQGEPVIGAAQ